MSFSILVQPPSAEMLAAMGDIYAGFEKKFSSSASSSSSNHTTTTTKASSSSSSFPITEYKKLDGSNFVAKTEIEEFEESLMAQYKSQTKGYKNSKWRRWRKKRF